MVSKICQLCKNPFVYSGKGENFVKYCSACRPLAIKIKEKRRGIKRRAKDAVPCPECGKPMTPKARWCRSCWFSKCVELKIFPQGSRHHWYKNGRPKTSEGYIRVKQPDHPFADHSGYVAEHRLVMEEHLGRTLNRKEFVHHLNGIRDDNRLVNLAVVSPSNHSSNTLKKLFQKRIRDLEIELSQQKLI